MRVALLAPSHVPALARHLTPAGLPDPLPAGMGGYCTNALIEARLRRGWPTDLITLDDSLVTDTVRLAGPLLRVWVVPRRKRGAVRDLFAAERRRLLAAVDEARPDVLHAHWAYDYGLAAVRQARCPAVLTVHDHAGHCLRWLGPRFAPLYLMAHYVMRRARHVTAVSPYVGRYVERLRRAPVPVIPNVLPELAWELGNARDRRVPAAGAARTVQVVSALNWSALKNTRRALCAVQGARKLCVERGQDLKYTLLGPGLGAGGPAEAWARAHGVAEGVLFTGVVSHAAALKEIAGADVLWHPSHEEALPGPVCEALAMRVPVVACREAGGSRWLCDEGRGVLCNGYNEREMAQALVRAAAPDGAAGGAAAQTWLLALTREEQVLERYDDMYRKAIDAYGH